ncbi:MAG: hypothetical protein ACSLFE_12485, partial [Gemmatimonadaceae bacterium]
MRQFVALGVLALVACSDGPVGSPNPPDACAPIFGFERAQTTAYYLTTIDGAAPPKTISLPQGASTVRSGQLELSNAGTDYLWAFYAGSGPLGASTILGQFARPREDGRIDLFVGNEPTQVRGIASVEGNGAVARVVTEDQPTLGMNDMGAHEFLFARCP